MADNKVKSRGLGRGLSALLPDAAFSDSDFDQKTVSIGSIQPNPQQPRHDFPLTELESLAISIKENGIIQPLVVTKNNDIYQLVSGERRWRAAQIAGLEEVPVRIMQVDSDSKRLELSLVENLQREDLNPVELAEGYRQLNIEYKLTQEKIAQIVGKDRATIANTIRLLDLNSSILDALRKRKITIGHAKAILTLSGNARRSALFKRIISDNLSVRQTEDLAHSKSRYSESQKKKPKKQVASAYSEYLDRLRSRLGTQVRITKRGRKGTIQIEFYSDDDLERLIELLNK